MHNIFFVVLSLLLLSSCVDTTRQRASLDKMFNSTSERVSFNIDKASSLKNIKQWVSTDKPAFAEVSCDSGLKNCSLLEEYLNRNNIAFENAEDSEVANNKIILVYDRVSTKTCDDELLGCSVINNLANSLSNLEQLSATQKSNSVDADYLVKAINKIKN